MMFCDLYSVFLFLSLRRISVSYSALGLRCMICTFPFCYAGVQLSQRTVEALKDYYTKLYDIPQNVTIYPNLVPAILERITNANKHPDNDEEDPANITSELDPATSRGYLLGDLLTTIFQKDEDFENPYLVRGVLLTMLDRQDIFGLTHLLSILKTLAEDNTDDDHMDVLYQTQSYR